MCANLFCTSVSFLKFHHARRCILSNSTHSASMQVFFCMYTGLFCTYTGHFWIFATRDAAQWVSAHICGSLLHEHGCLLHKHRSHWHENRSFWMKKGLFHKNIGLFYTNTGLFYTNTGLFYTNIGLLPIFTRTCLPANLRKSYINLHKFALRIFCLNTNLWKISRCTRIYMMAAFTHIQVSCQFWPRFTLYFECPHIQHKYIGLHTYIGLI